ncbi:MAG TPA: BON domain-containing protein [bacterium]|nr:BON domain-containing protein [bacterium]
MFEGPQADPKEVELEAAISRQIGEMGTHLHVAMKNGVVTLSGIAEDYEEKRRIDSIVKELAGHHKVVNEIRVVSTESSFDNNRH